jgi:hypothetical protein
MIVGVFCDLQTNCSKIYKGSLRTGELWLLHTMSLSKTTPCNRSRMFRELYKPRPRHAKSDSATYADLMQSNMNASVSTIESKPAPVSSCYADIMASSSQVPQVTSPKYGETSIQTPHMEAKILRPLVSDHAPVSIPTSEISSFQLPSALSTPQHSRSEDKLDDVHPLPATESVLFAPAEKKVDGVFGGWRNLKGDPVKLERLNQPRRNALESRWSC